MQNKTKTEGEKKMLTIDGIEYFQKEEVVKDINVMKGDKSHTFLEVGKIYAFRTVTMIYTGRLKAVSDQEYLVSECAWIPETERWMEFVTSCAHKEAEPYPKDVTINRGALLDCTEIPKLITKQK
jgi:hypothetical protein